MRNTWRLNISPYAEVLCAVDGKAVSFTRKHLDFGVGTPPSRMGTFGRFVPDGSAHVLSGADHVLFLLTLLRVSVLPSERALRKRFFSTLKLITGFTVGHSLTLIAASVGMLHVAPRLSETLIAFSIAVVALENLVRLPTRGRVGTVALFGLVHGLGFASALRERIPHDRSAFYALLGFNVGVELGQLALVALLWPVLAWSARKSWYRGRFVLPASVLVSALALIWSIKRALAAHFWPWLGA